MFFHSFAFVFEFYIFVYRILQIHVFVDTPTDEPRQLSLLTVEPPTLEPPTLEPPTLEPDIKNN
jgi:hypothetical protein